MMTIDKLFPRRIKPEDRFWQLARNHVSYLYNVAMRYAGNQYDAEDLVQETYFIAFKKFDQLRDTKKIKSWLFKILRNTYLKDQQHHAQRKVTVYDDTFDYMNALENAVEHVDVASAYERKIEADKIQNLLSELPEKYQSPILLYYISEMTYQEISETLDLPIGTVMSRLSRGKQMLKKKILQRYMLDQGSSNVIQFPQKDSK